MSRYGKEWALGRELAWRGWSEWQEVLQQGAWYWQDSHWLYTEGHPGLGTQDIFVSLIRPFHRLGGVKVGQDHLSPWPTHIPFLSSVPMVSILSP